MDTIGERIRRARLGAVLTQEELARSAGINRSSLSQIENGQKEPRPSTIRKIAQALDISPTELRGLSER